MIPRNALEVLFQWLYRAAVVFLLAVLAASISSSLFLQDWERTLVGLCLTIVPLLFTAVGLGAFIDQMSANSRYRREQAREARVEAARRNAAS